MCDEQYVCMVLCGAGLGHAVEEIRAILKGLK